MSSPYLSAINNSDRCIGKILSVPPPKTVLMLTSDQGGNDNFHGADSPEKTTILFITKKFGIPKENRIKRPIKITDIAPTITSFLGIEPPVEWTAKAVTSS